jgi:beta-N-acetylhexosaminidase
MQALLVLVLGAAALLGAEQGASSGLAGTVNAPAKGTASPAKPIDAREQEARALRGQVAQLMLVTLKGLYGPNSDDREVLTQCPPGGVVIPLIVKPQDAAEYITELRSMPIEKRSGIPLLVGANLYDLPRHERGGAASFAQLPSLLSISASGDMALTERLAKLTADHLSTMGFNLNLGPALDLAPTLADANGNVQHFGSNPNFAAVAGGTIITALEANGVLSMPMGFPGGGCNRLPRSPATLLTPRPRLMQEDLFPFVRAIERGAALLHVGNTLAPTIDAESRPASLSAAVMRDLIRKELRYQGVIVAGPMDAGEIKRLYDPEQAAILALEAGADMLYWGEPGPHVTKAVEAIARAVEKGALDGKKISAALERIVKLKKDRGLSARELPNKGKAAALATKGRYPKEAYEIERHSITLVQNRDNVLPLTKGASIPVGVTGVVGVEVLQKALKEYLGAVVEQPIATAKHLGDIEDFEISRLTEHSQGMRTAVCVFTDMPKTQGEARLVREFKKSGARVVVVLLGYPRALPQLTDADAIVLAYCDPGMCAESLRAVADVLVGQGPVAVLPAVREMKTQTGKTEVFNVADVTRSPTGRLPVSLAAPFAAGFTLSYDASIAIKKAEWDFGDKKGAKGPRVEHAFQVPGRYSVTLTVTDKHGEASSGVFDVVAE